MLLPAGTITLSVPWILPSGTRIVGEGVGITTLSSGIASSLIEMGSSTLCSTTCTGIGVQDLSLTETTANGVAIDNAYGQDHSYVKRVTIFASTTNTVTGLKIEPNAVNSGPYEDITFSGEQSHAPAEQGPACVWITKGASGIKIKGLNCIGNLNFGVAVLLDGSNDSIEDVYISNVYTDGILVGVNNNVSNDVLLNIAGGGTSTVHMCPQSGGTGACSGTSYTVEDLSMMGIASGGATNSIKDDITSTTLTDPTVAMYILGESVQVELTLPVFGHARFTTSPNTASWGVGSAAPTMGSCSSAIKGALFSNTSGDHTNHQAFWVCGVSSWLGVY